MKWFNYKEKWKSRFASTIEISSVKTESNRCFHRKPEIILWSLRSFWVERFDLNQSLNIDFGTKPFLYQCKNSARNRFFPRSRLGQMTYRKLKPHPSWHLLHAPVRSFSFFWTELKNHWNSIYFRLFSLRCCLINTFNSMGNVSDHARGPVFPTLPFRNARYWIAAYHVLENILNSLI